MIDMKRRTARSWHRYMTATFFFLLTSTTFSSARKTRLTWVNGIAHNLDHMVEGQVEISKIFGGKPILFCHNPTAMLHDEDVRGYLSDLTQAGKQKFGRITAEVDTLVEHLKQAVRKVGRRGIVIHIAHSQGALITSLAAKQLDADEMKQIEVIAFGGAAALRQTPQTPFRRCINYYSVNDPLLMFVSSAAQALRSGLVSQNEFCFLAPRIGDPIRDHNLLGPTYGQALQWEGERFQRMYVSTLYRFLKFFLVALNAILDSLSNRVDVMFKLLLRPFVVALLVFRKLLMWVSVQTRHWFQQKIVRPMLVVLRLMAEVAQTWFRTWRGEEKYEPVPK